MVLSVEVLSGEVAQATERRLNASRRPQCFVILRRTIGFAHHRLAGSRQAWEERQRVNDDGSGGKKQPARLLYSQSVE